MRTLKVIRVAARSAAHHIRQREDSMRPRHVQGMGVTLIALVAMGAIAVSAAQAAEYGRCLKTTKVSGHYTGNFKNGSCTKSGVSGASKYEWYPGLSGPASQPYYTAKTKALLIGEATVGSLVCNAGTDVGEITGAKEGWDVSTATGCIGRGSGYELGCNSSGEPPLTVQSSRLTTHVFTVGTAAWTEYYGSPYVAFECPGYPAWAEVAVVQWVTGVTTPTNKMTTKFTTAFTISGGEQQLMFFYSDPYCTDCGPEHATLERTSLMRLPEKWEIRT